MAAQLLLHIARPIFWCVVLWVSLKILSIVR